MTLGPFQSQSRTENISQEEHYAPKSGTSEFACFLLVPWTFSVTSVSCSCGLWRTWQLGTWQEYTCLQRNILWSSGSLWMWP